ncbi:MAG: laminin sub domain 2, partial [Thermoleophilia bacterium]|nr:laminin sub domain 2 [Thermoleophilia bacterium]
STTVSFTSGSDGSGSGIGTTSLRRASAPYSGGNCGTYTSFSPVASTSPYVDNGLTSGVCYRYELLVTDNVNNGSTVSSPNEVQVDDGNPFGTISPPTGPISGNGNPITGTATDPESGVAGVTVTYSGPASGTICTNQAVVAGAWTCSFDTNPGPVLPDGTYTLTLTVRDIAGNEYTTTEPFVVDNVGPVISAVTLTETGGGNFLHNPGGTTMYFNPAGSGTLSVNVTATDAGAGMDRVIYPDLLFPAIWTGGGDDSSVAYQMPYSWTTHAAGSANPGAKVLTARDLAGNTSTANFTVAEDSIAPGGVSIAYASATLGVAAPAVVNFTQGTDGQAGVLDWRLQRDAAALSGGSCAAFPGTWTNVGPVSPASSPYSDASVADGFCYRYRIVTRDNVDNARTITGTDVIRVDQTRPSGSISGTPAGPSSGVVTFTGTGTDLASGVQSVKVDFAGTPNPTGNICTGPALGGTPAASTWSCNWDTTVAGITDGVYTITLTVTDWAGNLSLPITRTITIDNNDPTVTFAGYVPGTNPNNQYWSGTLTDPLFYNPALAGSFAVRIQVTDPGTGPSHVIFPDPDLGVGGWSVANGTVGPAAPPGSATYQDTFTWSATAAQPNTQSATGFDVAGGSSTANYTILADSLAPTGGSISYPNQFSGATGTISIPFVVGNDGPGSGVREHRIWRSQTSLSGGSCGAGWGAAIAVGATSPATPFVDTTALSGFCYRYELRVTDNVGNVASYPSTNEVRVDHVAPTGAIDGNPVGPVSGAITVGWTSSDGESGVAGVSLTWTNNTTLATGPICGGGAANGTCPWNTASLPEGTYTITGSITDNAGNVGPMTRTIVIDNTPPVVTFLDFVEGSAPGAQHWNGGVADPMYYNPNVATGSFTVRFNASDAGSGMQSIAFPGLGAGWSPGAGNATPGAPPLFFYTYTWNTTSPNVVGTQLVTAFDVAGSSANSAFTATPDASQPTGGAISSPVSIQTTASIAVNFSTGGDTGSGVGAWHIERRSTSFGSNACLGTGWGGWSQISTASAPWPVSPYTDTAVVDSRCYEYRLVVIDRVGNASTFAAPQTTPVDITAPTGDITAPAASAQVGGNNVTV